MRGSFGRILCFACAVGAALVSLSAGTAPAQEEGPPEVPLHWRAFLGLKELSEGLEGGVSAGGLRLARGALEHEESGCVGDARCRRVLNLVTSLELRPPARRTEEIGGFGVEL